MGRTRPTRTRKHVRGRTFIPKNVTETVATKSHSNSEATTGVLTLGDARTYFELALTIPPFVSMFNFDADVKKTTARHQCENRQWMNEYEGCPPYFRWSWTLKPRERFRAQPSSVYFHVHQLFKPGSSCMRHALRPSTDAASTSRVTHPV